MAPPMSAGTFLDRLGAEGVTVVEVGDWRHHNRNHKGPWGPVHGVLIHHTATPGSKRTVAVCRDGDAELPGPLCHGVITKDGVVHLVGYGVPTTRGWATTTYCARSSPKRRCPR